MYKDMNDDEEKLYRFYEIIDWLFLKIWYYTISGESYRKVDC